MASPFRWGGSYTTSQSVKSMIHVAPKVGEATKYTVIEARSGDDDKNIYEALNGVESLIVLFTSKGLGIEAPGYSS